MRLVKHSIKHIRTTASGRALQNDEAYAAAGASRQKLGYQDHSKISSPVLLPNLPAVTVIGHLRNLELSILPRSQRLASEACLFHD